MYTKVTGINYKKLNKNSNLTKENSTISDTTSIISTCPRSIYNSTSGPHKPLAGRVSPVSLPGCQSFMDDNFLICCSGSGQVLTNLFSIRLKYKLETADILDDTLQSFIIENCKNENDIVGVIVIHKQTIYVSHNSPHFLFAISANKPIIVFSKCKNYNQPSIWVKKF